MFNEKFANAVLVLASMAIASVVGLREMRAAGGTAPSGGVSGLEFQADWVRFVESGIEVGTPGAAAVLLMFNDFECGGCRLFHDRVVGRLRERGDLSIRLLHKPLRGHRFALIAARAAECGDQQDRAHAMVDALFTKQDSIGLKSWQSFGVEAGVPDPSEFVKCVTGDEELPRIAAGLALAERLKVSGTPTLMLNGWLLRGLPSEEQFFTAVQAVVAGGKPVFD